MSEKKNGLPSLRKSPVDFLSQEEARQAVKPVAALSGVEAGSCVLTLQHASGRTQRVHVCRHDGRPAGMVYTDTLDLLVMNDGAGETPTDEGLAQAVATVAHAVARNAGAAPAELLAHAERLERFAATARLR